MYTYCINFFLSLTYVYLGTENPSITENILSLQWTNCLIIYHSTPSFKDPLKNRFQLFTKQSRLLTTLSYKPFENIMGKGENAGNQHFLPFPQCFKSYQRQKSAF